MHIQSGLAVVSLALSMTLGCSGDEAVVFAEIAIKVVTLAIIVFTVTVVVDLVLAGLFHVLATGLDKGFYKGVHIDNVRWPVGDSTVELHHMRNFFENPIVLAVIIVSISLLIMQIGIG
mgnify:CR=1 FL=1